MYFCIWLPTVHVISHSEWFVIFIPDQWPVWAYPSWQRRAGARRLQSSKPRAKCSGSLHPAPHHHPPPAPPPPLPPRSRSQQPKEASSTTPAAPVISTHADWLWLLWPGWHLCWTLAVSSAVSCSITSRDKTLLASWATQHRPSYIAVRSP